MLIWDMPLLVRRYLAERQGVQVLLQELKSHGSLVLWGVCVGSPPTGGAIVRVGAPF